ncbi:hypothetical protein GOBAR_DD19179 [Gossypium barbadense]|nr:hypothetical protein GOBAR_DD19179 [Gossypium barbadense]
MDDLSKSSMKFFSDQQLCFADILLPHEVQARIQVAVLNFLKILSSPDPAISDLPLINRKSSNSRVSEGILTDVSWIFLSHSFCSRSLMKANATKAFIRALLRCSRYSLGIMASSKGLVAGRILLQEPNQEAVDCSACGSSGYAISGDLNLLESLIMKTDARYIVVVEKHAIFQRLAEDHVFNQIPSILLTAKGYPDIATRFLLHRMSRAFPDLPILALVDCNRWAEWTLVNFKFETFRNPAGLAILSTYKFGSIGMGLEAYRYACNVKWLGLRGDDLQLIPQQSLAPLKPRDLQIARSLISSTTLQDNYRQELAVMMQSGQRAEIEALYFNGYDYLGKYLAKKIVQANYI